MRRPLDWDLRPADVLRLLRSDAHPVALLGSWAGGSDIIASEPTQVRCPPQPLGDVLGERWANEGEESGAPGSADFGGGWIGYLGFGLATEILQAPPAPGGHRRLPEWWFGYYDHVLRRDQDTGAWVFEALWTPERSDALECRFADLSRRPHAADAEAHGYECGDFQLSASADEHRASVRRAIDYIGRGDIFQANICLQLEASFSGDPLDAFCRAAERLQPPYAGFLRIPSGAVASLSPELFLRRTGSTVITRPIKGTRHRPADRHDAVRERDLLLRSDKDRAENVMIVDLMRNDLSRVCAVGSVVVPRLLSAEAHPGVWHLVSDVQGTIRAGTGDADLVAATFPPGSVTGAPKVRAVEVIHELETMPRELYTGALGYRSPAAGLELNVAIRTFEFHDDRVWLGSGGGITVRSDPAAEYRECLLKATPLIEALGARIGEGTGSTAASMRPRAAAGVFTSLALAEGRVADLDGHLARLDASTWQLYGKHLPSTLRNDLLRAVEGRVPGRLRVTARPMGGPLQVSADVLAADPAPASSTLHAGTVPGGMGHHKWLDRRLLAGLTAGFGADEHLLVLDSNGDVLETDRANVFAVIGGVLHTPPADERILPGVTRAAVLRIAGTLAIPTHQSALTVRQLAGASELFVTSSVHGISAVRALGSSRWEDGPVTARLRAGLAELPVMPAAGAPPVQAARRDPWAGRLTRDQVQPLVVLIDNYDSFTYNLAHLLLAQQLQVEVIRNDEVSVEDLATLALDGIVISPGPCTPAEAGISVGTIQAFGATTPILGVCLGHQAIAVAYGGQVTRAPRPVHGQASAIAHDDRGVLHGLPQEFLAARYHSLLVDEDTLPACLQVTARTLRGLPMGLRHVQHPVEGLQFHPESILTLDGGQLIGNFTHQLRRHLAPRGLVTTPVRTPG